MWWVSRPVSIATAIVAVIVVVVVGVKERIAVFGVADGVLQTARACFRFRACFCGDGGGTNDFVVVNEGATDARKRTVTTRYHNYA